MLGVNRRTEMSISMLERLEIGRSLTLCFRLLHRLQARATRPLRPGPGVACGCLLAEVCIHY